LLGDRNFFQGCINVFTTVFTALFKQFELQPTTNPIFFRKDAVVDFLVATLKNLLKQNIPAAHRRTIGGTLQRSIQQQTFSLIRKLGLKVITRKEVLEGTTKHRVFKFDAEETIVLNNPCNSSDKIREILNLTGTHVLKQPFVLEVQDAKLIGSIAIGFDDAGNIIS
jgi:hypothetical protein